MVIHNPKICYCSIQSRHCNKCFPTTSEPPLWICDIQREETFYGQSSYQLTESNTDNKTCNLNSNCHTINKKFEY